MRQHARYSPSKLAALQRCPCFDYGDQDASAASEGTDLHYACETGDMRGLTPDQRDDVQACLDYVDSVQASGGSWTVLKEPRLILNDRTYGHADLVLIGTTSAHVMDYKFIRKEGDYRTQIRAYGAALYETILDGSEIRNADGDILYKPEAPGKLERISTHLIAPRIGDLDVEEYDGETLYLEVTAEIDKLYADLDDPFRSPCPDQDLCAKCRHAHRCPALSKVVVAAAPNIGLPLPSTFAPDAMVSVADRALAQILAGAFTNWADQVKKNNAEFVQTSGEEIPHFRIINKSTGIRVTPELTPLALVQLEAAGFERNDILESCNLALGKLAAKAAESSGKPVAEVKEEMQQALGDLVTEGRTSYLTKSKRIPDEDLIGLICN